MAEPSTTLAAKTKAEPALFEEWHLPVAYGLLQSLPVDLDEALAVLALARQIVSE
jgi:hypothetical protein